MLSLRFSSSFSSSSLLPSFARLFHVCSPVFAESAPVDKKPAATPQAKKATAPPASTPSSSASPATPRSSYSVSSIVCFKDVKAPVIEPDNNYPPWIFDPLFAFPPSLAALKSKPIEELTPEEVKRYVKLERKAKIKQKNEETRKDK
jgi:large subunit ribosomal protein L54